LALGAVSIPVSFQQFEIGKTALTASADVGMAAQFHVVFMDVLDDGDGCYWSHLFVFVIVL